MWIPLAPDRLDSPPVKDFLGTAMQLAAKNDAICADTVDNMGDLQ